MKLSNQLLTVVFILLSNMIFAQYDIKNKYYEDVDLSTIDIFLKEQVDTNTLGKVINIHEYNLLKKSLTKDWRFNNYRGVLSASNINTKVKSKEDVWYIDISLHKDKYIDRKIHTKIYYLYYSHYSITLSKNKKRVISIPMKGTVVSELDIVYALNLLQDLISNKESFENYNKYVKRVNENSNLLPNKTLLVSSQLTNYTSEYLTQQYGSNVKVVNENVILDKIAKQDTSFAYLMVTVKHYADSPRFDHSIIDCSTNMPLLIYKASNMFVKPCKHSCYTHSSRDKLIPLIGDHFKQYHKLILKSIKQNEVN